MFDNICKFLAENFREDLATWLLGSPVPLKELKPTELSNEPIRTYSLILLQPAPSFTTVRPSPPPAPPHYSHQLMKQINSLDFINREKSSQENLLNLGKTIIYNPSDLAHLIKYNSAIIRGHSSDVSSNEGLIFCMV